MRHPVPEPVGMRLVEVAHDDIYVEAFLQHIVLILGLEDDSDREYVVHFIEIDVFGLHFSPNGIRCLDPGLDFVVDSPFGQFCSDRLREVLEQNVTFLLRVLELVDDFLVFFWMFILETEVLQLAFDSVKSQSVSDGSIDIQRLSRNFVLLVLWLRPKCPHIVETVCNLDDDNTNVVVHGDEQFFEVLSLRRCVFSENATRNFSESVHNLCDFLTEHIFDVLDGVVSVFHDIMEQCSANRRASESDFRAHNLRYSYRVHDIWFSRKPFNPFVSIFRKVESLLDDFSFFPVFRVEV